MSIFRYEMKRARTSILVWSLVIGGMIMLCILLYPELAKEGESIQKVMRSMGNFTAAFGADRLNYGELMGFYGIYGGCMLGIGGIFYAAVLGAGMLEKEEREHTAEFLLTHPVSRKRVITEKLAAMIVEMLLMNLIVTVLTTVAFFVIGEKPDWDKFFLFHFAQILMQFEILCICFGISAFLKKGGMSIGIGVASVLYFLGVFGNITEKAEFAKYITPYAYADGANVIPSGSLDTNLIALGMIYAFVGVVFAYMRYSGKDIC